MTTRRPLPSVMHNPAHLAPGDSWRHQCPLCPLVTQGGIVGLELHFAVVHSEPLGGQAEGGPTWSSVYVRTPRDIRGVMPTGHA